MKRCRPWKNLSRNYPEGVGFDWTGMSYQERIAGSQAPALYAFSMLVIVLFLAALYESWTLPISIVLALPLGVIGGVLASSFRGLPNDVYFQIGLLTTLGLTTKNAILIVVFAKAKLEEGMGLIEATLEGARLRFRPIVMTSLAFGFGVLPLALATGPGAGCAKGDRHLRSRRNDHGNIAGDLLHSTLLCCDLPDIWKEETRAGTDGRFV